MLIAETLKAIDDTQLKQFITEVDYLMQNDLNSNWANTQIKQWVCQISDTDVFLIHPEQFNNLMVAVFKEAALRWSVMLPPPTA